MKLIIDIPEEVKKVFDNATKEDIYGCFYDHNSVIGNAIKNGTPLEEELEKIKAEFEDRFLLNQTVAIKIIDNHISELKGEK